MTKAPNCIQRPLMGTSPESQRFFQRLFVDFLGSYPRSRSGHIRIFIVLDHYTKFVFLKADVVIKYMQQDLFHTFGVPETIVSDKGSQFKSEAFQKFLRENNPKTQPVKSAKAGTSFFLQCAVKPPQRKSHQTSPLQKEKEKTTDGRPAEAKKKPAVKSVSGGRASVSQKSSVALKVSSY
ncbi:uncharacterized protein LOC128266019 [Drosophila gunungcola]|uniref:uncharacterized protein LOC128266019 n=1 Tax=Drosophila gunungcola TaxID=103775 RepID=UPI0022DEEFD4|nr:uncharacterized protein LOC128266019 [Drosophila gunungcola]